MDAYFDSAVIVKLYVREAASRIFSILNARGMDLSHADGSLRNPQRLFLIV